MVAYPAQNESSSEIQSFTSRYKDEIRLANLFRSATSVIELLNSLKEEMRGYFDAEAFTIYYADNKKNQIVSKVKAGRMRKEIRLPIDKSSLAGYVASTGSVVNIVDAYNAAELQKLDPGLKFNRTYDDQTQFITRQVLSAPVYYQQTLFGVIQLLNKKSSNKFSREDVENIEAIASALGRFVGEHLPSSKKKTSNIQRLPSSSAIPTPYSILVQNSFLSEDEVLKAISRAERDNKSVEKVLIEDFDLSRRELGQALAQFYGIPYEDLTVTNYNPIEFLRGKNIAFFLRGHCVPLHIEDKELLLAINNPNNHNKILEVQQLYRSHRVQLCFALQEDIESFLLSFRGAMKVKKGEERSSDKSVNDILDDLKEQEGEITLQDPDDALEDSSINDNAVVLLVNKIIEDAYHQMASDIHIEPYGVKKEAVVRYRIDGRCQQALNVPSAYIRSVVSRIKVLAKMDISEKRKPQDGKIRFKTSNNKIVELRVATLPTTGSNEDVVLRLLASAEPLPLNQMMRQETYERFIGIIQKPYGIVMVVGPTGSGKTRRGTAC